jgi:hypothetical protein
MTSDIIQRIFGATVEPLDSDYLDYFPLQDGDIPISSTKTTRLSQLSGGRARYFQLGEDYKSFLINKIMVKNALPQGEWYKNKLTDKQMKPILDFLAKEIPIDGLKTSVDDFDTFASSVVEDFAVITRDPATGKDEATLLHLCAPSDWNVDWAFEKSFDYIHKNVKRGNGNLVIQRPDKMVEGLIKLSEPVQRVGSVSFRPNNFVNRNLKYVSEDTWTWTDEQKAFIRFERQVVVPFPEINSFMLIVRSYYNNLLDSRRLPFALKALDNISPDVYHKVFLGKESNNLRNFLLLKARV